MFKTYILFLVCMSGAAVSLFGQKVSLTLIPPTTITKQVDLDIRAGIVNNESKEQAIHGRRHVCLVRFTPESLVWHKLIAEELWKKFGHHPSFYGSYVSEENNGGLDYLEKTPEMKKVRREEMVRFFDGFKKHCARFAPDKPILLATNSSEVPKAAEAYPRLLKNLDILCPFGFARLNNQPGELDGKETADLLQKWCDEAGSHLWLDLEVFNFDENYALYAKSIEDIKKDLLAYSNFEYQQYLKQMLKQRKNKK